MSRAFWRLLKLDKPARACGEVFAAVFGHEHHVFDTHTEFSGDIYTRLYGHNVAGDKYIVACGGHTRIFVDLQPERMPERMPEVFAVARIRNDLPCNTVGIPAGNAGADEARRRELKDKVRELVAELRYRGVSQEELQALMAEREENDA